jgi:YVTN family beta-propeller protein
VKVEISPTGKEGSCIYNFIYKESKADKVLKFIRGVISFNYIWNDTLRSWVEVGYKVEAKKKEEMGAIRGRIINAITKDPIIGALVYGEEKSKIPHEYTLAYRTNSEGYFTINYVPIGTYYVYATKEGFLKNVAVNILVRKDKTTDMGTLYLLPQVTTKVTTIKGRVLDKADNLIPGATVYLESTNKTEALPITTTSSKGQYTLSFISPGDYRVVAQKEMIKSFIDLTITEEEVTKKQIIKVEDIIFDNRPPNIKELKPDRKILGTSETTIIKAKVKDLDNDKLWYFWSCQEGRFLQIFENEATWETPSKEGNYKITITVKDKRSGEANLTIDIPIVYSIKGFDISPVGLCYDGEYLYLVDNKTNTITKVHPHREKEDEKIILTNLEKRVSFSGIAYDGKYFYLSDKDNDLVYKVSKKGEVITSFPSPGHSPQGLVFDGNYLWNGDYIDNKLYKINLSTGEPIHYFDSPGNSPRGLAFDGNYLLNSDSGSDTIYQIDPSTGTVIDSFPAPGKDPRGIVYDGIYLWCINEDVATIYRLRLSDYL